jgi:hypothetical protein
MITCAHCRQTFTLEERDKLFYDQIEVPPPKQCPDCRLIRRFMERNPKTLYYRTCDFTNKKTLSQYHKDHPFPVYSPEAWWSEKWDPLKHGQSFDFNRPFFEQFLELKNKVPHLSLFNTVGTIENSDYNNCTAYLKNCYLLAESDYCDECYYSNLLKKCDSVVDCSVCYGSELCYECVDCTNGYNLRYSQDSKNCTDSYFLKNCMSCSDCIGCINQRQKQYMIFNKQYSKEDYEKFRQQFQLHTKTGIKKLEKTCADFFQTQPHKAVISEKNQNSQGDHLFNSKNAFQCFDSVDLEDCTYCAKLSLGVKTSMDYNSWGNNAELMYQSSACGDHCYNLKFCTNCQTNMNNCDYCAGCFSSSDCFGCVGLKREKFCILNTKYSEEDYYILKKKIIEHMKRTGEYGEFFPVEACPFGYNETMAMDTFPLTKEAALSQGFKWHDEPPPTTSSQTYSTPNSISDVPDRITTELLQCDCGRNFKIIAQELAFYKKLDIPVPGKCPSCRHGSRMEKRNPLKLWNRSCSSCKNPIQTNYSPQRKETIYCESCYLETVY